MWVYMHLHLLPGKLAYCRRHHEQAEENMTDHASGERYFLYHSIGQYAGKSADLAAAMAEFAGVWGKPDDQQWPYALGKRQDFINRWRTILNAPDGTLTTTESVTASLSALIGALPSDLLRGRKILVAGDCFPSVHFLLTGLQERLGFSLQTVPLRQGASWAEDEDITSAWGPDVALALLTWISSTSSHRSDIETLVAHGRRMGSVIGVDITQGAGLLPFDVMRPIVDFTISTSLKWMCGTPGAGILHVAAPLIERCQPSLRGWFSQPNPFNWDFNSFSYAPDIRRFRSRNTRCDRGRRKPSCPGLACGAGPVGNPRSIIGTFRRQILVGIADLEASTLASPRDESQRGGSIMVALPTDVPAQDLLAAFRKDGISADARSQTLRLSPGSNDHTCRCRKDAGGPWRLLPSQPTLRL
jgi:kynureninase